jgi:rubrerythrin
MGRQGFTASIEKNHALSERVEGNLAERIKKSVTFSKGCAVQAMALPLPFVGAVAGPIGSVIGAVAMLVLVFVGARMSTNWFCGDCRKPIEGKRVERCPFCKATFK